MQFSFGKYFFLLIMCHEQEIGAGKVFGKTWFISMCNNINSDSTEAATIFRIC